MYCVPSNLAPAPYFFAMSKSKVPTMLGLTGKALGVAVSGSMVSDDDVLFLISLPEPVISSPVNAVRVLSLLGLESMILSFRASSSGSANAKGVINACSLLIVSLLLCPLRIKLDTSLIFYTHPKLVLFFEPPMLMNLPVSLFLLC